MRIIYSDFGGVLHPITALDVFKRRLPREEAIQCGRLFRWTYILDELLSDHQDVRIVVHSSWRQLLPGHELKRYLGPLGSRFMGTTDSGDRWQSIQSHISTITPRSWLILDDHPSEFPTPRPNQLVLCNPETGIWEPKIREEITAWLRIPVKMTADSGLS